MTKNKKNNSGNGYPYGYQRERTGSESSSFTGHSDQNLPSPVEPGLLQNWQSRDASQAKDAREAKLAKDKESKQASKLANRPPREVKSSFIPPGCDVEGDEGSQPARRYEDSMEKGFWVPPRLRGRNDSLIEAVNDWHYAMLNDANRNEFYWDAMEDVVRGKTVVDIGAGTGLLSLMASRLGAKNVLAIEASKDLVSLTELNMKRNQCENIRVIHSLSDRVELPEEERADVIVSETLGALMLGEGMLDYIAHARQHLAKPGAVVIPAGGAQYAMLIGSPSLAMVSSVQSWCCKGFDLSAIGCLQDTGSPFFTKQWGFRLNSLPDVIEMAPRVQLFEVDFAKSERKFIPHTQTFQMAALRDGVVHAVVASWEVWSHRSRSHRITTHPEDTRDEPWGFSRDMQWGQGLQLVEDYDAAQSSERNTAPSPFTVKAGELLELTVRYSQPCRQTFQFTLRRVPVAQPGVFYP